MNAEPTGGDGMTEVMKLAVQDVDFYAALLENPKAAIEAKKKLGQLRNVTEVHAAQVAEYVVKNRERPTAEQWEKLRQAYAAVVGPLQWDPPAWPAMWHKPQ
jgi:rubrerythrin